MILALATSGAAAADAVGIGAGARISATAASSAGGQFAASARTGASYRPGEVLLGFKPGVSGTARHAIARAAGGDRLGHLGPAPSKRESSPIPEPLLLRVPAADTRRDAARLRGFSQVAYAEPDYLIHADAVPNDQFFPLQWSDEDTEQLMPNQEPPEEREGPGAYGIPGADDAATKAWDVTTGSPSIVIGEVDTGVDFTHPDLSANIWSAPWRYGPPGNPTVCAIGSHGYNVLGELEIPPEPCDPIDRDTTYGGHGTHVAGILGAVGNNGEGVAGMNWHTTILPVRWLQSVEGGGTTAKLVEALEWIAYFKQRGVNVRVVNDSASFMNTEPSVALSNEIRRLGELNILFVTSAGNIGQDDDSPQHWYPCSFDLPNEICVTASNNRDQLPAWANWGPHTVDLAAPGASIYSTLIGGRYGYLSGGSMASPQVAGAAVLILSVLPSLSAEELKARILGSVDRLPAFEGRLISGGRLDVCKALPGCADEPPPSTSGPSPSGPPPSQPPQPAPIPVISSLRISPHSFKAAHSGHAIVAHLRFGAIVSYIDSQAAVANFTVLAPRRGVIGSHRACMARHSHPSRHHHFKSCIRYVPVRASFTHNDIAGANHFHFSGRLATVRLVPGSYVLRATPTLAARSGNAVSVAFRIVR